MLNRFIVFLIAVCFLAAAPAGAASNATTLRQAMNDFNYSINVEWDQKDQAFYEAQMEKFQAAMSELSAKGMTQAQMIAEARAEIKDSQAAAQLDQAMQLVASNNMSQAETKRLVMDMMTKSQTRGASWGGGMLLNVGILVGLIVVIAVLGGKSTCGGADQPECVAPACAYGYHYQCGGYFDQFGIYRFQVGCDYQWSCF